MRAWEIIEQNGWCQRVPARDGDGNMVDALSDQAVSFCVIGAIWRNYGLNADTVIEKVAARVATPKQRSKPYYALLLNSIVGGWNDTPNRTKEDVISLLKELDI